MVEESVKNEDGSEKKDEAEKKEKAETEKKPAAEKVKKVKEVVPPPPAVHKKDFEKDVVYLYQFNRTSVIPSMSPYCLKVETWLKLNGIKFEVGTHFYQHFEKNLNLTYILTSVSIVGILLILTPLFHLFSQLQLSKVVLHFLQNQFLCLENSAPLPLTLHVPHVS